MIDIRLIIRQLAKMIYIMVYHHCNLPKYELTTNSTQVTKNVIKKKKKVWSFNPYLSQKKKKKWCGILKAQRNKG